MTFSEMALKVGDIDRPRQVARAGIIAELEAVSEYEDMMTALGSVESGSAKQAKAVIRDIILDEKEHMGMFLHLLLEQDFKQKERLDIGNKNAEKLEAEVGI